MPFEAFVDFQLLFGFSEAKYGIIDAINGVMTQEITNLTFNSISKAPVITILTFLAYLPENKGMQTEWSIPRDLNLGPLALQRRDPLCQATPCRYPASEFVLIYSFA